MTKSSSAPYKVELVANVLDNVVDSTNNFANSGKTSISSLRLVLYDFSLLLIASMMNFLKSVGIREFIRICLTQNLTNVSHPTTIWIFPGSLKTGKYESMSILLLAKANISFTRKPTKCGTCMLLSWEFFRYYINQISASANHLFPCKYFCNIFPICMSNWRKKYVCLQLQQSEYLLFGPSSHRYLSDINLRFFHPIFII